MSTNTFLEKSIESLNKEIMFEISYRWQLINEIWELVKHSHTNKDYQDLKDFDIIELEEILTDCKNNLI
tara:strand:+ start:846 stop:1052 length:207 start_codon:yes stop_codon:yes gene_type:complete